MIATEEMKHSRKLMMDKLMPKIEAWPQRNETKAFEVTEEGKQMTKTYFTKADADNTGRLNLEKYITLCGYVEAFRKEKFGGNVGYTKEDMELAYNWLNHMSKEEGITIDDIYASEHVIYEFKPSEQMKEDRKKMLDLLMPKIKNWPQAKETKEFEVSREGKLQAIDNFSKADVDKTGRLNKLHYFTFCEIGEAFRKEKFGGNVGYTREDMELAYNYLNHISKEEGISLDDIYASCNITFD